MNWELILGAIIGGICGSLLTNYIMDKYFITNDNGMNEVFVNNNVDSKISKKLDKMLEDVEKDSVVLEPIDLSTCDKGDMLISSLGLKLEYVRPTNESEYLDHVVMHIEGDFKGSTGTRTNDGYLMKHNRKPESDHDIVKIIKKSK